MIVLLLLLLVLEDTDDDEKQQKERPFDHSLYTYILLLLHFWFLLSLLHAMPFPAIEKNAFEYEKTSLFQIQKRVPPDEAIMQ